MLEDYLPQQVNSGPWVTAYTLNALRVLPPETEFILPVCSMATPFSELTALGDFILPPLFREAADSDLLQRLIKRITYCFSKYADSTNQERVKVVEVPEISFPQPDSPKILAFSVDTAVEEHGPHLPLGTDTIQSYGILKLLAAERSELEIARPLEYGQLTWGLPFGYSIDITTELVSRYVTGYCNALMDWCQPESLYVVDVHGSITHRQAIVDGITASKADRWAFRWLHDPLAEFSSARGDQHAGGVETVLVEAISQDLVDSDWWPSRINDIAEHQMSFEKAVELTPHLKEFCEYVDRHQPNGVIGDIKNALQLDASDLMDRMLDVARQDIEQLLSGGNSNLQSAGQNLW